MADRLSALPDELLDHVLGLLPAHEAVRTSVLAPRWRSLWKSVRRLHITNWPDEDLDPQHICEFVNSLFLIRGCAAVDEVKFDYNADCYHAAAVKKQTSIWVRHALLCRAQLLVVHITGDEWTTLGGLPMVSEHLRKLELNGVVLEDRFLDFTNCPALEVLEISDSDIITKTLLSLSIKFLRIESVRFRGLHRTLIYVPSLVRLQLDDYDGTTPLLREMPSLETASIKPAISVDDVCVVGDYGDCCGVCQACCGDDQYKGRCMLLRGLSRAVNLELTAYQGMYIFRRDLRWCPTFTKLKTLLLNDWCVDVDLFPLVRILNHSPVLENLTLRLSKSPVFSEGNGTLVEEAAVLSRRLKIIKIICEDVDDRVCDLLKFLSTLDIEVTIKSTKEKASSYGKGWLY